MGLPLGEDSEVIVVVGGGGHAKVVINILRKLERYLILGYTDLTDKGSVRGAPYLGSDRELATLSAWRKELKAVLALGQIGLGRARYELWSRVKSPAVTFPLIISPDAIVNEEVLCGEGSVVMDGAVINSGASIGRGAILNTNCTIEHDVMLAEWVHVAPGATISGGVTIGPFSMIGAGVTIIEGIKVAADCIIGAGSTVTHDLKEPGVYVGSPTRRIK